MTKQSASESHKEQTQLSRRGTLAATGIGVYDGITGLGESAVMPAVAQENSTDALRKQIVGRVELAL